MMRRAGVMGAFFRAGVCLLLLLLSGCGGNAGVSGRRGRQSSGVKDVLAAGMAESDRKVDAESISGEDSTAAQGKAAEEDPVAVPELADSVQAEEMPAGGEPPARAEVAATSASPDGMDLDLTVLSSTMVYSEVFNMMVSPEKYIGKTIKMKGQFMSSYEEALDRRYYACIIQDATACCAQGIEFELSSDYSYPKDYPEEGGNMCVVGVFDTYEEDGCSYATLRNARLVLN
ncbi:MAG: hypothetical protein K6G18_17160 [Treponema sp.]|nr:hypothetical protein [Treponema sp.]